MQAYRAGDEADDNQDQARKTVADPTQIKTYNCDPADRTETNDPRDKPADLCRLTIAERNAAQARPADRQRQR